MTVLPPRLGRRGTVLLLLGAAWLVQAAGIVTAAWDPISLPPVHDLIPRQAQAVMWAGPGLTGVLGAWSSRTRSVAYGTVMFVPAFMATLWLVAVIPVFGLDDPWRGVWSGLTWAIVGALIWCEAVADDCPGHSRGL